MGQVELSNSQNDAWRLNDGYVFSDDPGFEPFRGIGVERRQFRSAGERRH
ncbi:MAG: hypothetical protein WBM03_18015 [Steroidobacteraceae bacterium]